MELYDESLDTSIKWEELRTALDAVNLESEYHSKEALAVVTTFRDQIREAVHQYFLATQSILEWTTFATRVLRVYVNLLTHHDYTEKVLALGVLDEGIKKMNSSLENLNNASQAFDMARDQVQQIISDVNVLSSNKSSNIERQIVVERVAGYASFGLASVPVGVAAAAAAVVACLPCATIVAASAGIAAVFGTVAGMLGIAVTVEELYLIPDLEEKLQVMKEYYGSFDGTITYTRDRLNTTTTAIREEIKTVADLKGETKATKFIVLSVTNRHAIIAATEALITQCKMYHKRHGPQ